MAGTSITSEERKKNKLLHVYVGESWRARRVWDPTVRQDPEEKCKYKPKSLAESVSQGQMLRLLLLSKKINGTCPEVRKYQQTLQY